MRNLSVAITASFVLLFGCGHVNSAVPQVVGHLRSDQFHVRVSPDSLPKHFTILYSFHGIADGGAPVGNLLLDGAGNLYGTTFVGGTFNQGVVFKLDQNGNETLLHTFHIGGVLPWAGVVRDPAGSLYGTTIGGGPTQYGVVFKLDANGNESVLHSFKGTGGREPTAAVIRDAAGNLYGTTSYGGNKKCYNGCGVVFKLGPGGQEIVLHHFHGGEGFQPQQDLIRDSAGNLYGTTPLGGAAYDGVLFKLDASGIYTILHNFNRQTGSGPLAGVIRDSAGNLYGTTQYGGSSGNCRNGGCGVVFKLDVHGNYAVIHNFNGNDGAGPQADLIRNAAGDLFGTTKAGGLSGNGVVFRIDPNGHETVLHSFTGTDGAAPLAGLARDAAGNLYGTTSEGGVTGCNNGCGVVFKLSH